MPESVSPGASDAPDPDVSLGDDGALVTLDLSAPPATAGGVAARILGGLVFLVLGAVIAVGSAAVIAYSLIEPTLQDWADLIADAAYVTIPLGLVLAVIGFEMLRRARKRRAANADSTSSLEALADVLGATGLADVEQVDTTPGTQRNPPPPKTLI